jgi:murein DD-endopeptidase MepM/ murein hydrolase activator NlpD
LGEGALRVRHALSVCLIAVSISASAIARAQTPEAVAPPDTKSEIVRVRSGDTLTSVLVRSGVPTADAQDAVSAIQRLWNPRELKVGQEITLDFGPERLEAVRLAAGLDRDVRATRGGNGHFASSAEPRARARVPRYAMGVIRTSLYEAAVDAGVPLPLLSEMTRAFSYDVDFQREVQPGDTFELLYERIADRSGKTVASGDIVYASMTLSGKALRLYRYVAAGSRTADFFNSQGHSVKKALLKTPIDGARLTSGFGMRMHPILGYSMMHRGVDFGAVTGTPIMAAGDGVVEKASADPGYGNLVLLRHNTTHETAYAHMSGFAKGIKPGVHVRQGQVIGYVGATGRATGPHLHYEVRINTIQVNPLSIKMESGRKLAGHELRAFRAVADELDRQLLSLRQNTPVAIAHN